MGQVRSDFTVLQHSGCLNYFCYWNQNETKILKNIEFDLFDTFRE
jgi:hypothetical protein